MRSTAKVINQYYNKYTACRLWLKALPDNHYILEELLGGRQVTGVYSRLDSIFDEADISINTGEPSNIRVLVESNTMSSLPRVSQSPK
jgi:hypothetical protein